MNVFLAFHMLYSHARCILRMDSYSDIPPTPVTIKPPQINKEKEADLLALLQKAKTALVGGKAAAPPAIPPPPPQTAPAPVEPATDSSVDPPMEQEIDPLAAAPVAVTSSLPTDILAPHKDPHEQFTIPEDGTPEEESISPPDTSPSEIGAVGRRLNGLVGAGKP